MFRVILFLSLLIFGYSPSFAGDSLPPVIKRLLATPKDIIIHTQSNSHLLPLNDLPPSFKDSRQQFVKSGGQLYLLTEGTGRVYGLEQKNGEYSWKKLDSTYFTGYNYGCLFFGWKNNLYSFGGTGFWLVNGMLRMYHPMTGEWMTKKTNKSIPWYRSPDYDINSFYFLDSQQHQLFIKETGLGADQSVSNPNVKGNNTALYALDISNGNWKQLGHTKDSSYQIHANLPWGLFVNWNTVIDLQNNRYLRLSDNTQERLTTLINGATRDHKIDICYAIDSTLYIGNFIGRLDSITISKIDLIDSGIPFYNNRPSLFEKPVKEYLYWLVIVILSLALIQTRSKNKRKKHISHSRKALKNDKSTEDNHSNESNYSSSMQMELLDESEKTMLQFILDNSIKEKLTSLDDLNMILGTAGRSQEVQKRMRSIVMNGINEKLGIVRGSNEPLICKQRSEIDKRSFEYYIKPELISFAKKILEG